MYCTGRNPVGTLKPRALGQITLYTPVSWFRDQIISHVVVSDYMQHNKTSAVIFTDKILAKLPDDVTEVKIWTDGPASQFKNKYVIAAMKALSCNCHGAKLVWNFFATSHGKGPVECQGHTETYCCRKGSVTTVHHKWYDRLCCCSSRLV